MSESRTLQPPRGPACEGPVLIIEVVGQDHPEGHRFRLLDPTDQTEQEWMDQRGHREALSQSELAVWPTTPGARQNVWLDIDADDGSSIRVPLFENVGVTARQPIVQWNRVCPLVPITSLMAQDPHPGAHPSHPVPVRAGYVYVFRNGRLWRELQVDAPADRPPGFRDVRLSDYRQQGRDGLTEDRRPAVGRRLDAIWVPLSEMDRALTGQIQMAFSEVQWPGDRVAFLEKDAAARQERCQSLSGDGLVWQGQPLSEGAPAPGTIQPMASLPPARAREPFLEQHLPDPWRNVLDLTGNYAHGLYQKACDEQTAFDEASDAAWDAWEAAGYRDCPLRWAPAARLQAFAGRANQPVKKTQPDAKPTVRVVDVSADKALWEPLGAAPDAWADARTRGYASVTLNDDLFEVRHSLNQTLSAQRYLTAVLEAVNEEPYGDSAQLIERVMGPEYLGGRKNPLNDYLKNINNSYFGALQRTLKSAERRLATESLGLTQTALTHLAHQPRYQNAFADLFALKGLDYAEGFALFGDLVSVLRLDPNTVDPLNKQPMVSREQVRAANAVIFDILDPEKQKPLSAMVFPKPAADEELDAASERSAALATRGDGRFRPDGLRSLPDQVAESSELQTLTAASLMGVAKGNSLNVITEGKRIINTVHSVLDSLEQQLTIALMVVKRRTIAVPARLYGPLLAFAKARNPKLFGDVKLMPRNAIGADMVMLGVHDPEIGLKFGLTEADRTYVHSKNNRRRFFGEFRTPDGKVLATTRRSELPDPKEFPDARNVKVFVADKDSNIVRYQRKIRIGKLAGEFSGAVQMPFLVVGMEILNMCQEKALFRQVKQKKGKFRAYAGLLSAFSDMTVAAILAIDKLSSELSIWGALSKGLNKSSVNIDKEFVSKLSGRLGNALPKIISRRMFGGLIAAGLTVFVSLLDMSQEIDSGDYDSAIMFSVSAFGSVMTLVGSLMSASAAESGLTVLLLGFGSAFWVWTGLALAFAAGISAVLLDDPPLVDWLKRGPFGGERDDLYEHLIDNPSELHYRLVGLLSKPSIKIERVHDISASIAADEYSINMESENLISYANTRVTIENNVLCVFGDSKLSWFCQGVDAAKVVSPSFTSYHRTLSGECSVPLFEQPTTAGVVLYFYLPESRVVRSFSGKTKFFKRELAVRAQWHVDWLLDGKGQKRVFPCPDLHKDAIFRLGINDQPDFSKVSQMFWADEGSH